MKLTAISALVPFLALFSPCGAQTPNGPGSGNTPDTRIYSPAETEQAGPLATKFLSNLWLDQKAIWTSPFHINRHTAPLWIGFTAATAALIATDHQTSTIFENSRGQIAWGNHISNVGAGYTVAPIAAGFYLAGLKWKDSKARETGVLGGEALLDSLIVVEVLKTAAGRLRPNSGTSDNGEFFDRGASFPSGHAIESWSLASVIAHEYHHKIWVQVAAYGLAGVVSAARFSARQHYASDLLAGGPMGWFIGRYVYETHTDRTGDQNAWLHPHIQPVIQPSTRAYGVGVVFGR